MAVVDDFVNDFINEDEVFADAFFVEDATVVPKDLHHAVDDVHHERKRHVVFAGGHEIDPELFRVKEVQTLDILQPIRS